MGGCKSRPLLDLCRHGIKDLICQSLPDPDEQPYRKSFFKCYDCLRDEVRAEIVAKAQAELRCELEKKKVEELALKEKQKVDAKARETRIRCEAREKALREREEDAKRKQDRKAQVEKDKREGGLWINASAGKKGKGRKSSAPATPVSAPPRLTAAFPGSPDGMAGYWGPKKA